MCGIAGIVGNTTENYSIETLEMTRTLQHRGPDSIQYYNIPGVSFGHARLSIVDLSSGSQPMLNGNEDLVLVFNGEIYGYREIRQSLEKYTFRTNSDTEVILALYEEFGEQLLSRLSGMFSFALWDKKRKRLFAARDRFGEKPFYYTLSKDGRLYFASEIKALLTQKHLRTTLNEESLVHYLKHLYVPANSSIYDEIKVLPAGHFLVWEDGHVTTSPYWHPSNGKKSDLSLMEAASEFRRLFDDAVGRQLVADVPVGAFLSGGLDSSSVVAIAAQHLKERGEKLNTFSFKFEGAFDETHYARQIAEKYQTNHSELVADSRSIASLLLEMPSVYDEPFADSSNIPTYLISGLARKKMKVILTGDGADELLGGYSFWYKPLLKLAGKRASSLEYFFSKAVARLFLKTKYRDRMQEYRADTERRHRFGTPLLAHINRHGNFNDVQLKQLLGDHRPDPTPFLDFQATNTIDDALNLDLRNYMVGDILVKTDRASMAHGLELRAPFLDVHLAEFILSLPARFKIDFSRDKIVLREALGDFWTEEIRSRPKAGFGAPVNDWLKLGEVNALVNEYLLDPKKRMFSRLDFNEVKRFATANNYQTWILLCLSIWWETCPI